MERRAGRDRAKAIEVSSSTAGRAVFFSGLAVMISLAGLDHPRRVAVHLDGDRDDLGRVRVRRRQPDVPAGDPVDPRRPGQPRPAGGLAARASPWRCPSGRSAAGVGRRWPGSTGVRPKQEGSGFWGRLVTWVMARPVPMTIAVGRVPAPARLAGAVPPDGHHRHHRLPRLDRWRRRHQAAQREVAAGHRAPAPGRRHRGRPARDAGRHRDDSRPRA